MAKDNLPKPNDKVGGYLVGEQNGTTVIHNDGDKGGLLLGKRHSDGGIKAVNQSTGQPLEVETLEASITSKVGESNKTYNFQGKEMSGKQVLSEINQAGGGVAFKTGGVVDDRNNQPLKYKGGEIILTRPSVLDTTKREFNGKMMTNLEIASYINQQNGGVAFSEKDIPESVKTNGKSYELGGKLMEDHKIVSSCGCKHSKMEEGGKVGAEEQIVQSFLEQQEQNVYGDEAAANVAEQFSITTNAVKKIIKESGLIADDASWFDSFNWNSFSLNELVSHLKSYSGGEIELNFLAEGEKDIYTNRVHDLMRNKKIMAEIFSIGDVGKEIQVNKGRENIYASLRVYSSKNKIYTIGLFSKENHDGLKSIVDDIVNKFEKGGKVKSSDAKDSKNTEKASFVKPKKGMSFYDTRIQHRAKVVSILPNGNIEIVYMADSPEDEWDAVKATLSPNTFQYRVNGNVFSDFKEGYESGGELSKPVLIKSALTSNVDRRVVLGVDADGRSIMITADGYDNKGSYIGASEVLTDNDNGFYIGSGNWSDEDAERLFPNYKQRHAEISAKIKAFADKHPTVKGMTFFDTRKGKRARIVSVTRGLVNWEYYKADGVSIDAGKTDSLDTKQFLYLLDSGAYQSLRFVGDEKHEHGGTIASGSHKFNKDVMKMNANAKKEVIQIVLTKYSGGIGEKEEHLKRLFEMNNIPYSREAVKDIYYSDYVSHGGWRDFDYYTSWIFDEEKQMADGGKLKVKVDMSTLGDEIINAISKRSGLSAVEFNMKKAKEYLDYVNSTEGLEEVRPKAERDYELAQKAYNDLRDTNGTVQDHNIAVDFPDFKDFENTYTYNTSKSFGDTTHHVYVPVGKGTKKPYTSKKVEKEEAIKDIYKQARYEAAARLIKDELISLFPDAEIKFFGERELASVEFVVEDGLTGRNTTVLVYERGNFGFSDNKEEGLNNYIPHYYVSEYEEGNPEPEQKEFDDLYTALAYAKGFSEEHARGLKFDNGGKINVNNMHMAKGGTIKKDELHAVNAIKKHPVMGSAVGYKLRYNGIDSVILFAIEGGNEMISTWIDTDYFNKPEFRTESGYYQMGPINKEIIRLLTEHNLNSIAKNDVKSTLLETLYIDPNNPPVSDFADYAYAKGGKLNSDDEYGIVEDIKWVKTSPKINELQITHDGDIKLRLLAVEYDGEFVTSQWVDTKWFDRAAFKKSGKYLMKEIKDEVIRLLKLGELNGIARKDLKSTTLKSLRIVDKEPEKKLRLADIPANVKAFMPLMQQRVIVGSTEHWEVLDRLNAIIAEMPKTYETDSISASNKIVYLHYFYGNSDWYIVEKDSEPEQLQAYGYASLGGGMGEWGYINIEELKSTGKVELDFFFKPVKFETLWNNYKTPNVSVLDSGENEEENVSFEDAQDANIPTATVDSNENINQEAPAFTLDYMRAIPEYLSANEESKAEYTKTAAKNITQSRMDKLQAVGLDAIEVKSVFWGYQILNPKMKADGEFEGYINGLMETMPEYWDKSIDRIVEYVSHGYYEAGLKYLEIKKWERLFDKYGVSLIPVEVIEEHSTGDLYQYAMWSNVDKTIYISKGLGYKSMDKGKVVRDSFEKFDPSKIEFGGGYEGIVTKDIGTLKNILADITNDSKNYVKDLNFLDNGLGGIGADYFIEQDKINKTEAAVTKEMNAEIASDVAVAPVPSDTDLNVATLMAKANGSTKDQYALNSEIKALIQQKGNDRAKYSAQEIAMLKLYSGSGGLIKQGAKGTGILDQFYTPNDIIAKMWGLALKYGFKFEGANILEPAVGVGRFLQYIPKDAKPNLVLGYDIDPIAATICQLVYPEYTIKNASFETMFFQGKRHIGLAGVTEQFDIVITNPPYREYVSEYSPLGEKEATGAITFEMYFLMRGIDVLKAGGLLIVIIPSSFMANEVKYNDFKTKLAEKADLLDGFRLASGVFDRTDVTTDILVLRKKSKKGAAEPVPSMMENANAQNMKEGTVEYRIDELKKGIKYVNDQLSGDMDSWERKEYEQVRRDYEEELTGLLNDKADTSTPTPPPAPATKKVKTWGGSVPAKDDFGNPITNEFVDGMSSLGGWAMMSPQSFAQYGTGLGAGRGQRYQKKGTDWVKVEG